MANQTIPGLNSITAPSTGALLWVSDPDASPQDRSLSLSALLNHYATAFIQTLLDDTTAALARATLGIHNKGYMNLSFSTLGTGKPDILGSVEVNGTLVTFAATTPTGSPASPSDNWVYVSDAGAVSFDATNAPAWSTAKGGWYYGNLRAVAWVRVDSSGYYRYHHFLPLEQQAYIDFEETINIGDWNMDLTPKVNIAHGLTYTNIIDVSFTIRADAGSGWYLQSHSTQVFGYHCIWYIDDTTTGSISLERLGGSGFDSAACDATTYNRGRITIKHREL